MLPYTATDLSEIMRRELEAARPRIRTTPATSVWQSLRRLASGRVATR
jgi:hypothetical protein